MKKINTSVSILFIICFLCSSQILISQESKFRKVEQNPKQTSTQSQPNNIEGQLKTKVSYAKEPNTTSNVQKRVDTEGKSFQLDENDSYQGRKEEFLSQIILKELPMDFPKYEKWMGVRHYNEVIDDYYKKHLDILNPIVKQKLTQVH